MNIFGFAPPTANLFDKEKINLIREGGGEWSKCTIYTPEIIWRTYLAVWKKGLITDFTWGPGQQNRLQLRNTFYFKSYYFFDPCGRYGSVHSLSCCWTILDKSVIPYHLFDRGRPQGSKNGKDSKQTVFPSWRRFREPPMTCKIVEKSLSAMVLQQDGIAKHSCARPCLHSIYICRECRNDSQLFSTYLDYNSK